MSVRLKKHQNSANQRKEIKIWINQSQEEALCSTDGSGVRKPSKYLILEEGLTKIWQISEKQTLFRGFKSHQHISMILLCSRSFQEVLLSPFRLRFLFHTNPLSIYLYVFLPSPLFSVFSPFLAEAWRLRTVRAYLETSLAPRGSASSRAEALCRSEATPSESSLVCRTSCCRSSSSTSCSRRPGTQTPDTRIHTFTSRQFYCFMSAYDYPAFILCVRGF